MIEKHTLYKFFEQWSLKEFSIEDTPWNIAKDIIDYFNTLYWSISSDTNNISWYLVRYTSESIDITWDTINIDFSDESCFSALWKCIEVTPFRFYISEEGIVYFQKKENSKKVKATYWKDLVSIKKRKSKTDIVNRLYLSNGTLEQTYNKASSQALYPLSEKVIKKTYLNDLDTMDQYAENYLEIYWEVVPEITVEILTRNSNEIKPLDIFSTENSLDVVEDIEIIKIDKKLDRYILYLGSYTSLWDFFIE